MANERIEVGFQTFIPGTQEEFGAVRGIAKHELTIYVENSGEFVVPLAAVLSVHSEKVTLDPAKLDPKLLLAIQHAHDAEE